MARQPTEEEFLRNVADHRMMVLLDAADAHRHLLFKAPETGVHHFRIVTFADYLAYAGDMGSFTFRRTQDMFRFFRSRHDGPISFDAGYWAQKVEAQDSDGVLAYSAERFKEAIANYLQASGNTSQALRDAIAEEVLSRASDGEDAARRAVERFSFRGFHFIDFWDYDLREHTYRFIWACYAIVWAIRQYDAHKAARETVSV